MEYYANDWCVTVDELTRDDRTATDQSAHLAPVLPRKTYDTLVNRGKLKVLRQGKGKGNYALISYESLPQAIKERLKEKYPAMEEHMMRVKSPAQELFRKAYARDYKALSYYIGRLATLNTSLSQSRLEELANEYATNASVIQAVQKLRRDNELYRKVRGRRGCSWADMSDAIKFFQSELGHTLGVSPTRFAQWVKKYETEGYDALISKKFGNVNTLKVTHKTERLLMELASDKHRPYGKTVWQWYCAFLSGEVEYISPVTGEIYDPAEFPDLSEKTVGDVLSKPLNEARLSKTHDARHDYQTTLRPYHKRIKPKYSLSMVSMDDKDFSVKIRWCKTTTKLVRGKSVTRKQWIETSLKAYLCYDVASEAIIGWSFSGEKTRDIFEGCIRSMYRNLLSWGLGQPHEAQVENHLVSLYKETMMKSGVLFPEVTFAGAENSQEKYAERYNEVLKYQFEKHSVSEPIGRPHARLLANRTKNRKVSDETNENYLQGEYSFEEAVRAYEQIIEDYNNAPHPKQKLYPGKSRLEVLLTCVHPEVQPINMVQLARWVGWGTKTSVVRGKVQAGGEDYAVATDMLDRLTGRDDKVEAYWWKQDDDEDTDIVYLYQDDVYLGECDRIVPYQVSKLERTRDDMRRMARQQSRIVAWDKAMEERATEGLLKVSAEASRSAELNPIRLVAMPQERDVELYDVESWERKAKDYAQLGISNL